MDTFNDFICIVYDNDLCVKKVDSYPSSIDPGVHYLLSPLHKDGTIIMLEGQYRGYYKFGTHNMSNPVNRYSALEQCTPMAYVRDNNKDSELDIDISKKIIGIFKIHLHRCSKYRLLRCIRLYSAGCQLIQNPKHFDEFMVIAKRQQSLGWGDKFSYTLFNLSDL